MRRALALIALLALSACGERQDPQEKARDDARDVAKVEALQSAVPPEAPFALVALSPEDLSRPEFAGMGCVFEVPKQAVPGDEAMVFANERLAAIHWNGALTSMASDAGSTRTRAGVFSHYVGKTHELRFELVPGEAQPAGEEAMRWRASARLYDAYHREIWQADGALTCGV